MFGDLSEDPDVPVVLLGLRAARGAAARAAATRAAAAKTAGTTRKIQMFQLFFSDCGRARLLHHALG
jgi:hypothetical protein